MDILAHGLCTSAAAILLARRAATPIRLGWALFFGVLPDLASFTVPAVLRIWWRLTGVTSTLLPQPGGPRLDWVFGLYNCFHSLLIFGVVFTAVWIIVRKPVWELLGWLLHIAIDIPTHTGWFAIQSLWPVSSFHFDGIPWETGWLLAATYTSLAAAFHCLWRTRARPANSAPTQSHPH
ncbi:MAG: hypothetical protein J0H49_12820 [Acidobacteria bacterium]|nr:hypothetical protein [Acidobacteriota bacterium]